MNTLTVNVQMLFGLVFLQYKGHNSKSSRVEGLTYQFLARNYAKQTFYSVKILCQTNFIRSRCYAKQTFYSCISELTELKNLLSQF